MIRNYWTFLLVFLLLLSLNNVLAAEPETHGYIEIHNVTIHLKPNFADVNVSYTLDDAFRLLVLMFGENDVKTRLLDMLAFENATITRMDFESAELKVYDVKPIYGDGLYWFPDHQFGSVIPSVTIISNQSSQTYENISKLENGTVYF